MPSTSLIVYCQNKTNKVVRYGNIFIFCSHYYRSKAIGRAEPGRWIFQPGHLTWCALCSAATAVLANFVLRIYAQTAILQLPVEILDIAIDSETLIS